MLFCGSASRGLTGTSHPRPQPQHMPSVSPILSPSCWASSLLNHASFRWFSVNSAVHTHLLCTQLLLNDQGPPVSLAGGWWSRLPVPWIILGTPSFPVCLPPFLLYSRLWLKGARGWIFPQIGFWTQEKSGFKNLCLLGPEDAGGPQINCWLLCSSAGAFCKHCPDH